MTADAPHASEGEPSIRPATLLLVQGLVAIVFGVILLAVPGRTLTLLGVVLGIYLLVVGIVQLARGVSEPGLLAMERAKPVTVGLIAMIAGILCLLRPDGSVRVVTIVAGIFLLVLGIFGLAERLSAEARGLSRLRSVLAIVAGILLIVAPSDTAEFAIVVLGIYLVVVGLLISYAGWRVRGVHA